MRIIKDEQVTARKNHICQSGLQPIIAGETYRRTTIAFDGVLYTWKQCSMCDEAMRKSDRSNCYYNEEEAYPEGWAKEDGVGCAEGLK